MQIFLPFPSFKESLRVLDTKRLGKQRVEAYQIISAITGRPKLDGTPYKGWLNHPCTIMWREHIDALKEYYNNSVSEWVRRGFANTMQFEETAEDYDYPIFLGFDRFHSSHRANLLKKDTDFYSKYGWSENPLDPYVWLDGSGNWYKQHSGKVGREYF